MTNDDGRRTLNDAENAFDESLKKAMEMKADAMLREINQDALFAQTMKRLPRREPRSFLDRFYGLAQSFKVTQATVAAAVIAVIGFASYEAYELSLPAETPESSRAAQSATIEDVQTENAAAMIAEGKGEAVTVIWIIEEEE